MNYAKLAKLVDETPAAKMAFSVESADSDKTVADILNAATDEVDRDYLVTWNDFFRLFGAVRGSEILQQINTLPSLLTHRPIYELMRPSEGGMSLLFDNLGTLVNAWQAVGAIRPDEKTKLVRLAKAAASPASKAGLGVIGDGHIQSLREIKKESRS